MGISGVPIQGETPYLIPGFHGVRESLHKERMRIDEIWIQFRAKVASHPEAVRGYVSALILWGFAGTLFGSFMALFQMGEALTQPSVSARITGRSGNISIS